jgi:hypothetical protein
MSRYFLLLLSLFISSSLFSQTGIISGFVKDKQTQQPIVGASIQLIGTSIGAVSDTNGLFLISKIPTKTYTVQVNCIGYEAQKIYNIVVSTGNSEVVSIEMEPASKILAEVLIKKNPFKKNAETIRIDNKGINKLFVNE